MHALMLFTFLSLTTGIPSVVCAENASGPQPGIYRAQIDVWLQQEALPDWARLWHNSEIHLTRSEQGHHLTVFQAGRQRETIFLHRNEELSHWDVPNVGTVLNFYRPGYEQSAQERMLKVLYCYRGTVVLTWQQPLPAEAPRPLP